MQIVFISVQNVRRFIKKPILNRNPSAQTVRNLFPLVNLNQDCFSAYVFSESGPNYMVNEENMQ